MAHSVPRRNPYIIGRPIDEPSLLFGRHSLFCFLEDSLRQGEKVILLHGQRRIGKSSIIRNIPKFVNLPNFVFIAFDLADYSQEKLSKILLDLAKEILERLNLESENIKLPNIKSLEKEPYIFYSQFLAVVNDKIFDKNIVFVFDEFDAFNNSPNKVFEELFTYLHSLSDVESRLFAIIFVGRKTVDMPNLLGIFECALTKEIQFLEEDSARQLITKPAEGFLEYEPDAIQAIIQLSAGHPYFTQNICFAVFSRARELQKWHVTSVDVDNSVSKAIENAEAGLAWFWDGLSIPEKVVFSAVAETQKIAINKSLKIPTNPLRLLKEYGVVITSSLEDAFYKLVSSDFLNEAGNQVKIELVRRWLLQRHPLRQEIKELEKIDQETTNDSFNDKHNSHIPNQTRLHHYQQSLEKNPNHFSDVLQLAEGYLQQESYEKALELYDRAYQVDSIRNKEGLLQALEKYANKSTQLQEFEKANQLFDKVLAIEPFRFSAREKKSEIEAVLEWTRVSQNNYFPLGLRKTSKNMSLAGSIIAGSIIAGLTITTILAGISISSLSAPCSASEKKVLGIFCVADPSTNISSGERTLFPITGNSNRDLGIQEFTQQKYANASQFFQKAIKSEPSDPEVLIYYNNSLAREKKEPFSLAVVVPVDKAQNLAKEILRGVALAQTQFNSKGGLNGRLLQIVIANDTGDSEKRRKLAEELIKDESILGIIGNYTSEIEKVALTQYKQANLAVISPISSSVSMPEKNLFKTASSNVVTAELLAEYAISSGLDKVVIVANPENQDSISLSKNYTYSFQTLGGQVVREIDLAALQLNIEREAASVLEDQAQGIVMFPDSSHASIAVDIMNEITKLAPNSNNSNQNKFRFLGGDTLYNNKTLSASEKSVDGLVIAVPWYQEAAQAKDFSQAATQLWGKSYSWRSATSFDAAQALIKVLSANPSRTSVLEALKKVHLSPSETSGYPLEFTDQGERSSKPILLKFERGKFKQIK
jgi:ABC-type branched-subunit amino acid transport system substrate-binding protein